MLKINSENLFFIIGLGRSGTSLLQELMNTFDNFCNLQESEIHGPGSGSCWTNIRISNNFSDLENFILKNWKTKYFVEKMPDSITCLPQLANHFPNANYIFIERNPIKIIISQLNLFPKNLIENAKKYHLDNYVISKIDAELSSEQYWAKLNLDHIRLQQLHKHKFKKSLTIRYESLIENTVSQMGIIEKYFHLDLNPKKIELTMKTPSYSSQKNQYDITSLTDNTAIEMINQACNIWNYPQFLCD